MSKRNVLIGALLAAVLLGLFFFRREPTPTTPSTVTLALQEDGGHVLLVDGERYFVRGVCYNPIPVGKDYTHNYWGDPSKPWLKDGKLMREMGVNTVRFYGAGSHPEEVRRVIGDLHRRYGIRSLLGHFLGFWDWPPANYADPVFREKMKNDVLQMVRLYKDEPGILGWILGNENNYSFDRDLRPWSSAELDAIQDPAQRRKAKAAIYYRFINDLALAIKEIDSKHPVIMGVGEVKSLDTASKVPPDIDVIGIIAYRGPTFGNLFRQVKQSFDKPVLMIEWGADSFNAYTRETDEKSQDRFITGQWKDIERNSGLKSSKGNCIGGTLFEWSDEWWKANENLAFTWAVHDQSGQWPNSSYYYDYEVSDRMNMNEEWFGVVALKPREEGSKGLDARVPKKIYYSLKDLWKS